MTPRSPPRAGARRRTRWPHRLGAALAAALLALPGAAHPIDLPHLLRLPLEELLRLEITASTLAAPPRVGASLAPPMASERSAA